MPRPPPDRAHLGVRQPRGGDEADALGLGVRQAKGVKPEIAAGDDGGRGRGEEWGEGGEG